MKTILFWLIRNLKKHKWYLLAYIICVALVFMVVECFILSYGWDNDEPWRISHGYVIPTEGHPDFFAPLVYGLLWTVVGLNYPEPEDVLLMAFIVFCLYMYLKLISDIIFTSKNRYNRDFFEVVAAIFALNLPGMIYVWINNIEELKAIYPTLLSFQFFYMFGLVLVYWIGVWIYQGIKLLSRKPLNILFELTNPYCPWLKTAFPFLLAFGLSVWIVVQKLPLSMISDFFWLLLLVPLIVFMIKNSKKIIAQLNLPRWLRYALFFTSILPAIVVIVYAITI